MLTAMLTILAIATRTTLTLLTVSQKASAPLHTIQLLTTLQSTGHVTMVLVCHATHTMLTLLQVYNLERRKQS